MGCDIHVYVERKNQYDKWIPVFANSAPWGQRDYEFFSDLADVRSYDGEHPQPLGLPDNVSESVFDVYTRWGPDAHSASWLPLVPFIELFYKHNKEKYQSWAGVGEDIIQVLAHEFLWLDPKDGREEINNLDNHRVVFWFDN